MERFLVWYIGGGCKWYEHLKPIDIANEDGISMVTVMIYNKHHKFICEVNYTFEDFMLSEV